MIRRRERLFEVLIATNSLIESPYVTAYGKEWASEKKKRVIEQIYLHDYQLPTRGGAP